jgi:hypothetical protein
MRTTAKIEFGDFQTPLELAQRICALLRSLGNRPDVVVEPTCGLGAFLQAAAEAFPKARLRGFDINASYVQSAGERLRDFGAQARSVLRQQDFFLQDWDAELHDSPGKLLILGNLPWVTNQTVASLNGSNVPVKENFLGFRGIAARTGKSNFDISEWMLIRLVRALRGRRATIAMLCKTATARKLLRYAWQNDGRIVSAALYRIDAKYHFDASVDACLLMAHVGKAGPAEADVFASLAATARDSRMGLAGQDLVADIDTYRQLHHLEGLCPHRWRSGVKHDCASVMELQPDEKGILHNKLGEPVSIEPDYLYPLLKCSDLANARTQPERFVLITQRRVGDDTAGIAQAAPRTWVYLNAHREKFKARRSSIYTDRAPFALFGIGDYAFAPWKVAVSGLHRHPRFMLVPPVGKRPVLFDDTCYYLPFAEEGEARVVADILNSPACRAFLDTLMFPDSKRPVTVELLQRLNLSAIAEEAGLAGRWQQLQRVNYSCNQVTPQLELIMETPQSAVATKTTGRAGHTRRKSLP